MKIATIIATRGKPQQVIGVIESMRMLASGENELEFIVACDDDDPAHSHWVLDSYAFPDGVRINSAPRPNGVGACWNRCVALTDAEVLLTLPDDGIIATPKWDHCIAWAWRNHQWPHSDLKIASIRDSANPGQPTMFIFGKMWAEMVGHLFDERYFAWFSDTAIAETYSFITGEGFPVLPIDHVSRGGRWNPRLRKMKTWWTHFGLTRNERLETARQIRQDLGLPEPVNLQELVNIWKKRDAEGLPSSEEIVRQMENPSPLDDRYLACEAAALEYISSHSGQVFEPSKNNDDRF